MIRILQIGNQSEDLILAPSRIRTDLIQERLVICQHLYRECGDLVFLQVLQEEIYGIGLSIRIQIDLDLLAGVNVRLLDLFCIGVIRNNMDHTIGYDQCNSSVIIVENIAGGSSDTGGHGGSLDLEGLIIPQMLHYLEKQRTLGQLKFQHLSLLDEFRTAVILQSDDLGIVKSDRSQSVGTGIQGIPCLETGIVHHRLCFALRIFDVYRSFYTEKPHGRGIVAAAEKHVTEYDYGRNNDQDRTRKNDLTLSGQILEFINKHHTRTFSFAPRNDTIIL